MKISPFPYRTWKLQQPNGGQPPAAGDQFETSDLFYEWVLPLSE
jgi:hypothetical protein